MEPLIRLDNVWLEYPGEKGAAATTILESINLQIAENDIISLLGPSGCGKSTLIRLVAGLIKPTRGTVKFHDKHNIEEAVYLAKRIVVLAARPGRVAVDIANPLPYPRAPSSPEFLAVMSRIRAALTHHELPEPAPEPAVAVTTVRTIPHVNMNEIIGLTNVVTTEPSNIFDLGNDLGYEFSKLLVVIKAAELLDLVTTPAQNVLLTETGRRFLAANVSERRTILRKRMMALPLFNRLVHIVEAAPDQVISIIELFDYLKAWFPNENLQELARTIIGWSRFAGLLVYSTVSLGLPENMPALEGEGALP